MGLPIEILYNERREGGSKTHGSFFDIFKVEVDAALARLIITVPQPGEIHLSREGWARLVQLMDERFEEEAHHG